MTGSTATVQVLAVPPQLPQPTQRIAGLQLSRFLKAGVPLLPRQQLHTEGGATCGEHPRQRFHRTRHTIPADNRKGMRRIVWTGQFSLVERLFGELIGQALYLVQSNQSYQFQPVARAIKNLVGLGRVGR